MGIFKRLKKLIDVNTKAPGSDPNARTLFNMRVGDVVSIDHIDYEILGSIKFNDKGWEWIEYKLKDGRKTYWLSVEEDDDIEIYLFEEIVAFTTEPSRSYEYEGTTYYLQEGSDATVKAIDGRMNVKVGQPVDYFEYADRSDEKYLSIEIWDGEVEMSLGTQIEDYQIEIYPGSNTV